MALTGFLLFVVHLVFAVAIVEILGGGPVFALFILGGFSLVQYFFSDTLALRSMGAREVSEDEYPALHDTITRLSRQADLPKPTVVVAESRVPNAFATGRGVESVFGSDLIDIPRRHVGAGAESMFGSDFTMFAEELTNSTLMRGGCVLTRVGSGSMHTLDPTSSLVKVTISNASDWSVMLLS